MNTRPPGGQSNNPLSEGAINQRVDYVRTDDARVASIQMSGNEASPWHHHTHVVERIVCLTGDIEVQCQNPKSSKRLAPGEMATIEAQCDHRVVNMRGERSSYLLIQDGKFDFVTVNR